MRISCAFPPTVQTPDHIALADSLGYETAWVYDTPALQLDVWMTLALAAARTDRIRLGPGVLIPTLRHAMVTASAIATLVGVVGEERVVVGVGTGFTGRRALGQRPLRWRDVAAYVRDVRTLLDGGTAVVDGAATRMLHWPGQAPARPVHVPWFVAVSGPVGLATASELGCGVLTTGVRPGTDFGGVADVVLIGFGTILDPGETIASPRVVATAGPGVAVGYHAMYEQGADVVVRLPGGERYVELIEAHPAAERHLHVHAGHLTELNAVDREVVTAGTMRATALTCEAGELPDRLAQLASQGVTEVAFQPMGDVERELRTFAAAAGM